MSSRYEGSRPRAVVALDLGGPSALQSRDAARGLRTWADATGTDLEIADVGGPEDRLRGTYASWARSGPDIVLLPYGSGGVRAALSGVPEGRLVWNHGGSDDDLARPWAPMVLAPASTYFAPLVDLAADRGCRSVTVCRGPGRFAGEVSEGATRRAEELDLSVEVVPLADVEPASTDPAGALLVVGRFEDDVAFIGALGERPALTGCVAAGIPAFGEVLDASTEGILGPAQWWPSETTPELGPSGRGFADRFRARYGRDPSYVAAQAAAGGYLALEAARRSLTVTEVTDWSTSTLLGAFEVDAEGRQIGHRVTVVRWTRGRMVVLARAAGGSG